MINLNLKQLSMFTSVEKICLGVIGGSLLVSIVGAKSLIVVALVVGGISFGVRKLFNNNSAAPSQTPPASK